MVCNSECIIIYLSICSHNFYFIDEINYLLVLEYANSGTLGKYLDDAITLKWEIQMKFAKEIASAILCLHKNDIVHRDLVSLNNYILLYN